MRRLIRILLVVVVIGAFASVPVDADVRGRPNIDVYASDNRLSPGDETTLSLTLLNDPTVLEISERDPGLTDVVTTARGVRVSLTAGDAPVEVKTARQAIGNLPEGASQPIDFRVVVAEDAPPGRYELDVGVRYTYTRFLGEADDSGRAGVRYDQGVWEDLTITVVVERRAVFSLQDVESDVAIGTSGTLTLGLRNVGAAPATDATVTLQSSNPAVSLGAAETPARSFRQSWESGAIERFTVRARVEPDAAVRSYALTATVEYDDPDGVRRTAEAVPFGLVPTREQAFEITGVRSDLRVGSDGRLSGSVTNTGGTVARNAVVVVDSVGRTVTPTEREVALGSLEPGEQADFDFEFDVSDEADAGRRQFSFRVESRDTDGSPLSSDLLDVPVDIAPERDVFGIVSVDGTVTAGESGRLTMTIRNDGQRPVTDVAVKLFADDPISATDDEAFVDRLDPGENSTITFAVAAGGSALPKPYPLSLDFQYDDADGDTLLSDTYRVPVVVTRSTGGGFLPSLGPVVLAGSALAALVVAAAVVVHRRR